MIVEYEYMVDDEVIISTIKVPEDFDDAQIICEIRKVHGLGEHDPIELKAFNS